VIKRWLLALLSLLISISCLGADHNAWHLTSGEALEIRGLGYSAPPYEADARLLPGTWKPVQLPASMIRLLVPPEDYGDAATAPTVTTWYRLTVPAAAASTETRYLYIPRWKTDGQLAVYGDGRLLYRSHANIFWNGWNIPLWIPLNITAGASVPATILLRIERPLDSGGGMSSVWVGSREALSWRYHIRYLLQVQLPMLSSAAFLAVGLFAFFIWCRRRKERSYLLFFYIAVASFLRTLHYHVGEGQLAMSDDWFSWLTINSLYWMVLTTHFFINDLHRRPVRKLDYVISVLTALMCILTLPMFAGIILNAYILAPLTYLMVLVIGSLVAGVGYVQSRRTQSHDGLMLSYWAVLGMLAGIHDWLLQSNYISIESVYLAPYSNIGGFLIFMFILYSRYMRADQNVREVNASLKTLLQQREDELRASYQLLRESERRQTLSEERARLMQDMHDGMGSSLLTALLVAEKGDLDSPMLADVLRDCIDDLRLTIDSMEPVQTDLLLVLATLRFRLSPRLESAGIKLRWEVQNIPALPWLDPRNCLHILRILQEAFSNIVKHAHASEVRVATALEDGHVVVIVTDNGRGFAQRDESERHSKGLKNQLRRAASIGAEVQLASSSDGTCLRLLLPLEQVAR
jgi:signal transduction histidine kinase